MNIEIGLKTQNIINVNPDIKFIGYKMIVRIIIAKLEDANTLKGSKPFPIKDRTNTI